MRIMKKLVTVALSLTVAVSSFVGISVNAAEKESAPSDKVIAMESTSSLAEVKNCLATPADLDDLWDDDELLDLGDESIEEMKILNIDGQPVSNIVPSAIKTMKQVDKKDYAKFIATVPQGYNRDVIIPVKVKTKGVLAYALAASYKDDVYYQLYKDKKCTKSIYTSKNVAYLDKAGTYYIKVAKYDLADEGESQFAIAAGFISGANAVLKNKTNLLSVAFGTDSYVYFKFTVNTKSKIAVKVEADYSKYVTLCNSKKTAITNEEYISSAEPKAVYAVPKGTYYIRVKAVESLLSITPTFTPIKSVAGPSREKAGTLKMNGKTQNIAILPGDSKKTYYYLKFYNPKNQKVYLNVTSDITSGKMKLDFYDTKKTSFGTNTIYDGLNKKNRYNPYVYSYTSNNGYRLPKGTYYIRFSKAEKKTSGTIKINIKNKK